MNKNSKILIQTYNYFENTYSESLMISHNTMSRFSQKHLELQFKSFLSNYTIKQSLVLNSHLTNKYDSYTGNFYNLSHLNLALKSLKFLFLSMAVCGFVCGYACLYLCVCVCV